MLLVLESVAALVRRHADVGGGTALVILRGKHQLLVQGIIVIPQHALTLHNLDIGNPGGLENAGGSRPGQAGRGRHL